MKAWYLIVIVLITWSSLLAYPSCYVEQKRCVQCCPCLFCNLPNAAYCPSRCGASSTMMKNREPAELGIHHLAHREHSSVFESSLELLDENSWNVVSRLLCQFNLGIRPWNHEAWNVSVENKTKETLFTKPYEIFNWFRCDIFVEPASWSSNPFSISLRNVSSISPFIKIKC